MICPVLSAPFFWSSCPLALRRTVASWEWAVFWQALSSAGPAPAAMCCTRLWACTGPALTSHTGHSPPSTRLPQLSCHTLLWHLWFQGYACRNPLLPLLFFWTSCQRQKFPCLLNLGQLFLLNGREQLWSCLLYQFLLGGSGKNCSFLLPVGASRRFLGWPALDLI